MVNTMNTMTRSNADTKPTSPDFSWLDKYPEEYRDVLRVYGKAPISDDVRSFNERLMELADSDLDERGFGLDVYNLYLEIFGEVPEVVNGGQ
jgi:hypothetical protein